MTFCYFKCAFEQLEKDIYLFIYFFLQNEKRKAAARISCKDRFRFNRILHLRFVESLASVPWPRITYTWPPCIPFDGQSPPPPSSWDIVTQIKPHCWKAGELIGRSRASSSKLALPRNLWAARGMPMLPIRGPPPDKTFASLTGVGIRARGGCRWGIISCSSLCPLLDESRRPSWREFWW